MITRKQYFLAVAAALCALGSGCAPQSQKERDYYRKKVSDQNLTETLKLTVMESAKDTDVLQMVKQSPAVSPDMDTDAWVNQQMDRVQGQVIFPRWEVSRRGSSKYEARYVYTLLNDDNDMSKIGWRWEVDMMLKMIGPPRQILAQETAPRPRSNESQQQQRRIREEERSLE